MTIPDVEFFAWLDGELSDSEASAMEARVRSDPELSRLADEHRRLGERLKRSFGAVSDAPVPARLTDALRKPEPRPINRALLKRPANDPAWSLPRWMAMAASLAAGLFLGVTILQGLGGEVSSPVEVDDGRVFAPTALDHALNSQLASAPGVGRIRVGITFRSSHGQICRTFSEPGSSGVACRTGDKWQLRGLLSSEAFQAGDYRMASGMDPGLAAMVSSMMTGKPFDAAQERAAQANNWQ
jgi:hypothetical protein